MAGINKVILIGNLGKDPDLKYSQSGKAYARFSLATTERFSGEERTEWHNIVCFDRVAEIANEYLSKGRQVYIEGRIQTRSYEQDGVKKYMTEILVNTLQMLGRRDEGSSSYAPQPRGEKPPQYEQRSERPERGAAPRREAPRDDPFAGDFAPPTDDDIPF